MEGRRLYCKRNKKGRKLRDEGKKKIVLPKGGDCVTKERRKKGDCISKEKRWKEIVL